MGPMGLGEELTTVVEEQTLLFPSVTQKDSLEAIGHWDPAMVRAEARFDMV